MRREMHWWIQSFFLLFAARSSVGEICVADYVDVGECHLSIFEIRLTLDQDVPNAVLQ